MLEEHAQAVVDLLTAAIPLPNRVFNGRVADGTDPRVNPYVLVRFAHSTPPREFNATSQRFRIRIYCYSVGGNATAAWRVADLVRAALLDVRPAVAGRSCWPIEGEDGAESPPSSSEATGAQVVTQTDTYVLDSVPA